MVARGLAVLVLIFTNVAFAQIQNESELSEVLVSGNTESQSASLKQKTSYVFGQNTVVGKGRYLSTQTSGTTTARAWDANGRYERALSNYWSIFTSYGAESDIFSGYIQRDSYDLGAKYYFIKKSEQELIGEAGYRYTHTYAIPADNRYENFGRLFSQYSRKFTPTSEAKLWVEYLPNFTNPQGYLINAEPSLSSALSSVFSVKMSYLLKYQQQVPAGFAKHLDSTYSTALVASW